MAPCRVSGRMARRARRALGTLDRLAHASFAAHMIQHLLLIAGAAPPPAPGRPVRGSLLGATGAGSPARRALSCAEGRRCARCGADSPPSPWRGSRTWSRSGFGICRAPTTRPWPIASSTTWSTWSSSARPCCSGGRSSSRRRGCGRRRAIGSRVSYLVLAALQELAPRTAPHDEPRGMVPRLSERGGPVARRPGHVGRRRRRRYAGRADLARHLSRGAGPGAARETDGKASAALSRAGLRNTAARCVSGRKAYTTLRAASKPIVCAPRSVGTLSRRRIVSVSKTSMTPGSPIAT